MKDNFSHQAASYARYRPVYPPSLIEHMANLAPGKHAAWDCATGNGQVAVALAEHFESVLATDMSAQQLEHARPHPRIRYAQERAEHCSAADETFDLITVAQAVHWFDFESFFAEVQRVLRPDGILALIGYSLFTADDADIDAVVRHFYVDITGPYWDAERRHIDAAYQTIPFPLKEIDMPHFFMEFNWTADDVLGYFSSWSAVQHYIRANGHNPVELIEPDLRAAWGGVGSRKISNQLLLKVGRKT
ncbi:MAG: class I SAM-dependent methyltransferase [Lewinellaceae bacterium]|nr:class I SAM-dependent methyltransferase [Saprospiraceae bacterium]MCB9333275.1 class I SAM-dependent methyltransferase [Lewinellaceae bacterium]